MLVQFDRAVREDGEIIRIEPVAFEVSIVSSVKPSEVLEEAGKVGCTVALATEEEPLLILATFEDIVSRCGALSQRSAEKLAAIRAILDE